MSETRTLRGGVISAEPITVYFYRSRNVPLVHDFCGLLEDTYYRQWCIVQLEERCFLSPSERRHEHHTEWPPRRENTEA